MGAPKVKISFSDKDHVTIVVTKDYPASSENTAAQVWGIVADFSNVKTIFPSLLRNYLTYPDETQNRVGTIRDMTFGGKSLSVAIEQLKAIDDEKRSLTYISLAGLPVTNYISVIKVSGDNACTLSWTIDYDQQPLNKEFAKGLAQLFVEGENEIAKVLDLS